MSTLVVSNISDGTTTVGASYVTNGSAKAWVNIAGQGTATVNDSLNISSMSDEGTGRYRIYYSTSFNNADAALSGMRNWNGVVACDSYNSTNHLLLTREAAQTGLTDPFRLSASTHGDLA